MLISIANRARWLAPVLGAAGVAAELLGGWVGDSGAPLAGVARLAVDGLGAARVGLAVLPFLLAPARGGRAAERRRVLDRVAGLGVSVSAGWAVAALAALWVTAARAVGTGPFQLRPGVLWRYAGEVAAGRGLLLTLACAVLVGALGRLDHPEPALGFALLGVLAGPVTGHAAGHAGHGAAVPVLAVHVAAACLWAGGLLAVVATRAHAALARFSGLAGYSAGAVALTGVLSAVFELPSAGALVSTGYGLLLIAKAAGLAGILVLGRRTRSWLGEHPAGAFPRWVALELPLMAAVFGLAAALSGTGA